MKSPLITLLLLGYCLLLNGQIQKNTWSLGGETGFKRTTLQNGAIKFEQYTIAPEFLFFPSAKFGIGGSLSFAGTRSNNAVAPQGLNTTFYGIEIAPKLRYNLYQWNDGQSYLFMDGGASVAFQSFVVFGSPDRELRSSWGWTLGPGITHFLSPAIALEWQMFYNNMEFLDVEDTSFDEGRRAIGFTSLIRLRFYLNNFKTSSKEFYGLTTFNKGNWMIGGNANFHYEEESGYNLAFSPTVGKFLTDGLVIGLGPDIAIFDATNTSGFSWGLASFIRYYLPISSSLQFFPAFNFRYGRINNKRDLFSPPDLNFLSTRYTIGVGLNTLVQPNVGLELIFSYQNENVKQLEPVNLDSRPQHSLQLELGLQFFLTKISE